MSRPILPLHAVWSILPTAIGPITDALREAAKVRAQFTDEDDIRRLPMRTVDGVAIVDVAGPMEKRPTLFGLLFGGSSTTGIKRAIQTALANPDVSSILLRVDSPGGAVDGIAELADAVFNGRRIKPIHAAVDGTAASAAFQVASQATTVSAGRADVTGSIGTFMYLLDRSQQFEDQGIAPVMVRSGKFKGVGAPGLKITGDDKAEIQRLVDFYASDFADAVKRGRGMNTTQVEAVADGRLFTAPEALRLRLIDRIESFDAVLARLRFEAAENVRGMGGRRLSIAAAQSRIDAATGKRGRSLRSVKAKVAAAMLN